MAILSEWHRWDLHIHTPETSVNDKFTDENGSKKNKSDVWTNYVSKLNDYGAEVLGITDYFSAENFFKLRENRTKWGLHENIVIFPNIEMRANDLVSKKQEDGGKPTNHVNIHFIFKPNIAKTQLMKFLREVRIPKSDGTVINLYDNIDEIKKDNSFVTLPTTHAILKALISSFGENYSNEVMIMLPNSGDGISFSGGNGSQNGKDFLNKVNIIQARTGSALNDRKYLLQQQNHYSGIYPSVTGCDAHDYTAMSEFPTAAYTWIKSEPTFEGLKQITYEPETRIAIQESKPQALLPSKIIKEITLSNKFFTKQHLKFSEGLNTIIGGRSSGKSVLLSIMAKLTSNETVFKKDNDRYNELIDTLSEGAMLKFADGKIADGSDQIEFIYQDGLQEIARDNQQRNIYIENTLSSIAGDEIQATQQKKVIFLQGKKEIFRTNIDELKNIDLQNQALKKQILDLQDIFVIQNNLKSLRLRLSDLEISKSSVSREKINPVLHELQELQKNSLNITSEKATLVTLVQQPLLSLNPIIYQSQSDFLLKISSDFKSKTERLEADIENQIRSRIVDIDLELKEISQKENEIQQSELYVQYKSLENISPEIQEITDEIEKQEKFLSTLRKLKKQLASATTKQLKIYRMLQINSFFASALKEITIFTDKSIDIKYKTTVNFERFKDICQSIFKIYTNNFRQRIYDFSESSQKGENILMIIHNIVKMSLYGELPFKNGKTIYDWFESFSDMNFLESDYHIYYKRDDPKTSETVSESFSTMSEGKQAFILLLMKLSLAPTDIPFFIDQPEDELDNKAIYDDLVTHLRKQKITRQIFIVTHNANIVVGGDSECVILAEEEIDTNSLINHTFTYTQGPIESAEIQNSICETLEGGKKAFKIRETRYSFE